MVGLTAARLVTLRHFFLPGCQEVFLVHLWPCLALLARTLEKEGSALMLTWYLVSVPFESQLKTGGPLLRP